VSALRLSVFLFFLGLSLKVYSFEVPALTSPVMDEAGILSSRAHQQIETNLFNFKRDHGVQLQVYIVKSLQGEEIESAAIKIFDQWKLGDEKTDKGLLFLIAPNEKRMRIEVGQGLEGDVPDVIAKRIISDVVRPYFQNGQFASGIAQGITTIESYIINGDPGQVDNTRQPEEDGGGRGKMWVIIIVIGLWILLFIFNPSLALYILFSGFRGGGGGGFSGGGSWSGGGGRSSGGGASGSW
jgi:uncharacterized protein